MEPVSTMPTPVSVAQKTKKNSKPGRMVAGASCCTSPTPRGSGTAAGPLVQCEHIFYRCFSTSNLPCPPQTHFRVPGAECVLCVQAALKLLLGGAAPVQEAPPPAAAPQLQAAAVPGAAGQGNALQLLQQLLQAQQAPAAPQAAAPAAAVPSSTDPTIAALLQLLGLGKPAAPQQPPAAAAQLMALLAGGAAADGSSTAGAGDPQVCLA